ncbi:hypothetical protein DSECCO2_528240 [anaerobic digester metagenome]
MFFIGIRIYFKRWYPCYTAVFISLDNEFFMFVSFKEKCSIKMKMRRYVFSVFNVTVYRYDVKRYNTVA